jgi:nicotinamidase-related amidase
MKQGVKRLTGKELCLKESFNLEGVYKKKIGPRIAKLISECKKHGVPIVVVTCLAGESGEGGALVSTALSINFVENRTPVDFLSAAISLSYSGKAQPNDDQANEEESCL